MIDIGSVFRVSDPYTPDNFVMLMKINPREAILIDLTGVLWTDERIPIKSRNVDLSCAGQCDRDDVFRAIGSFDIEQIKCQISWSRVVERHGTIDLG